MRASKVATSAGHFDDADYADARRMFIAADDRCLHTRFVEAVEIASVGAVARHTAATSRDHAGFYHHATPASHAAIVDDDDAHTRHCRPIFTRPPPRLSASRYIEATLG